MAASTKEEEDGGGGGGGEGEGGEGEEGVRGDSISSAAATSSHNLLAFLMCMSCDCHVTCPISTLLFPLLHMTLLFTRWHGALRVCECQQFAYIIGWSGIICGGVQQH